MVSINPENMLICIFQNYKYFSDTQIDTDLPTYPNVRNQTTLASQRLKEALSLWKQLFTQLLESTVFQIEIHGDIFSSSEVRASAEIVRDDSGFGNCTF